MFTRKLTDDEITKINNMGIFIKDKHRRTEGHDYSHILAVTKYAIEIAREVSDPIDPFILIAGALLHDIGRVGQAYGGLHGLLGGAIAEEYLEGIGIDDKTKDIITKIITRHTPSSQISPESPEEKIVFDADALDRLGQIGILRGVMGKKGKSIEELLEWTIKGRCKVYGQLHYEKSRELGKVPHEETDRFIIELEKMLEDRVEDISDLKSILDDISRVE